MKLALLFCLFALSASAPTDPDSSSESGEHGRNETAAEGKVEIQLAASAPAGARQFGSRDSPTAVTCSTNCEKNWKKEQGLTGQSGKNWNINKYCEAHDKFTRCLNQCGTSEDKAKLLKRVSKDQWICHDSTYKRNAACLNDAFKSTAQTCDRQDKCGKFDRDDGSLKNMVSQLCSSMKCKLDCRGPTIVSKCGQAAKNDEAGVAKKTAEYLKWRIVDSAGRPNDYPARECDPLIRPIFLGQ